MVFSTFCIVANSNIASVDNLMRSYCCSSLDFIKKIKQCPFEFMALIKNLLYKDLLKEKSYITSHAIAFDINPFFVGCIQITSQEKSQAIIYSFRRLTPEWQIYQSSFLYISFSQNRRQKGPNKWRLHRKNT